MDLLYSSNPSAPEFYYPIIIGITLVLALVQFYIYHLQNDQEHLDFNVTNSQFTNTSCTSVIRRKRQNLKLKYLSAFLLTRASVWAKSPYIWSMYLLYHKFTVQEIGVLYVVDAISALIFGPITGNLADIFGRKRFCQFYNLSVCINLALRLSRNHALAYCSQVVTGIGAGLANTAFESWVVSESIKEFKTQEKDREAFLKRLFKTVNIMDACLSILISAMAAIIYVITLNVLERGWYPSTCGSFDCFLCDVDGRDRILMG